MSTSSIIFYLAVYLFSSGLLLLIIKRSAIFALMGIELMLNGAHLLLVSAPGNQENAEGIMLVIFTIVLAVAEMSIALAILILLYRTYKTTDLSELDRLRY